MTDERLTIYYPSGQIVRIFGRFELYGQIDGLVDPPYCVAITVLESTVIGDTVISPGQIGVVDPRCVIVGEKSDLVYSPREHCHEFPAEMREWMKMNADWPGRLKLRP